MSIATDRADAETLEHIGRNPGCKRRNGRGQASVHVNNAATARLVNAGLVTVTGRGRLYLTEAGTALVWADVIRAGRNALISRTGETPASYRAKHMYDPPAATRPAGQHDVWCVAGILACDHRCPGYVAPVACGIRDCDCHLVTT
jgi:hypothetical protein